MTITTIPKETQVKEKSWWDKTKEAAAVAGEAIAKGATVAAEGTVTGTTWVAKATVDAGKAVGTAYSDKWEELNKEEK